MSGENVGYLRFMKETKTYAKRNSFALVGDEDFFKQDAFVKLRQEWTKNGDQLDEDRFDGFDGLTAKKLDEYIGLPPMVGAYRVVVVFNTDRVKKIKDINYWLKEDLDSDVKIICLFTDETKDAKETLKGLDFACVVVCNDMGPNSKEFDKYLEFCMEGTKRTLSSDGRETIRHIYSDQIHLIKAELQKAAYLMPPGTEITANHLMYSLAYRARSQIFDVVDHILRRDVRAALGLMSELLARGEEPLVTVSILMRRLQQLEKASKATSAGERLKDFMIRTRMPLFQYGQILEGLRNVKIYHFQRYFEVLCEYESQLRSWGSSRNTAENMIVKLCMG